MTVRPKSFAQAWAERREEAINPLAFLATCASLVAALFQGGQILGFTGDANQSFGNQLLQSAGPFLPYAAVGALAHVALLRVSPRRRLLDSVAIGLYAGGPALVGYVLLGIAPLRGVALFPADRTRTMTGILKRSVIPLAIARRFDALQKFVVLSFVRSLWLGLAGLHGGRRGIAALATLFAMGALALVLGKLHLHNAPFGIQLVVEHRAGSGWSWSLSD